jgi:hypothetical protein
MHEHATYPAAGEVSDRSEKLDGDLSLTLDGAVDPSEGAPASQAGWWCTISLSWTLGREGMVTLNEGDLSLQEVSAAAEISAILESGDVATDPDTGRATVQASFMIEGGPLAGRLLGATLDIGVEEWHGTLRLA